MISKYDLGSCTFLADRCQILFRNLWNIYLRLKISYVFALFSEYFYLKLLSYLLFKNQFCIMN